MDYEFTWLLFTLWYFYFQWFPGNFISVCLRSSALTSHWPRSGFWSAQFPVVYLSHHQLCIIRNGLKLNDTFHPSKYCQSWRLDGAPLLILQHLKQLQSKDGHRVQRGVKHPASPVVVKNTQSRQTQQENNSSGYMTAQWNLQVRVTFLSPEMMLGAVNKSSGTLLLQTKPDGQKTIHKRTYYPGKIGT